MKHTAKQHLKRVISALFILILFSIDLCANDRILVWADEFVGTTIDQSVWSFEVGPTYETLHFFTDRSENARVEDGVLKIIALEEAYQGFDYTAAHLSTKGKLSWRHGRVEARIKLPQTTGFVPGFWMLPENDIYGWWPWGGEIDIMEHPTNQDKIFGTCHTYQYSYYTGSGSPSGGSIQVTDSESAFHVYAIDWTPERIDFYVDDQKYFTHTNTNVGFETWPFDQPFYLILAQGVGGGWVGNPDETTVFPAVMEVDYVRVYQYPEDVSICGPDFLPRNASHAKYVAPGGMNGYDWTTPNQAQISSGQQSSEIEVDWGIFGGTIDWYDGADYRKYPVVITDNLLMNGSFEKGVKYWSIAAYPAEADFIWTGDDAQDGKKSVYIEVKTPSANSWDAQLSQGNINLEAGKTYYASFWGKSTAGTGEVAAGVIHSANFTVYGSKTAQLTNTWAKYEFSFSVPASVPVLYNISMGDHSGIYYLDDFQLQTANETTINQLSNASFDEKKEGWIFQIYSPAVANMEVVNGESSVSISNGGINPWDIYLGQAGLTIEQGKSYTVSFDAYASGTREIAAFVGLNADPWTVYSGENKFILSDRRNTFDYSFSMENPSDTDARFGFDLGGSLENVIIDNVFLSPVEATSTVSHARGYSPFSTYNYPNPFSTETSIVFYLEKSAIVNIEVFNFSGEKIETVTHKEYAAGKHEVKYTPKILSGGVYFYKIDAGAYLETKKIIRL